MLGERITKIIAQQFNVDDDKLARDVKFDAQLDCNSTAIMDLASALEDEFEIAISDEEADAWRTVGDVIDFVMEATNAD